MGAVAFFLNLKHLCVRQQRKGERIVFRKLSANHQRGAHHAPERHHGPLLCLGEIGPVSPGMDRIALPQCPHRKHVRIRPVSRAGMDAPFFRPLKHCKEQGPLIPEIVRNPPHIGVFLEMLRLFKRRRSGREAEHNVVSRLPAGFGDNLNFPPASRILPCDVITFDKINAPLRIHPKNGAIIGSGRRMIRMQSVHIRIPCTDIRGIGRLPAGIRASRYRATEMRRHSGESPHDMDAKLQPQAVDHLRQRFKSLAILCTREPIDCRLQASVFIHRERCKGLIVMGIRRWLIPLDVHDDVFPAEAFQVLCHILSIPKHLCLSDRGPIAVPAVPAHGRYACRHALSSLRTFTWFS